MSLSFRIAWRRKQRIRFFKKMINRKKNIMKTAFVLSGGSIKGAFQAGVIADLLTSGSFKPDLIYGTKVI